MIALYAQKFWRDVAPWYFQVARVSQSPISPPFVINSILKERSILQYYNAFHDHATIKVKYFNIDKISPTFIQMIHEISSNNSEKGPP